jgi:Na+/H+-dicarboxylate symporter
MMDPDSVSEMGTPTEVPASPGGVPDAIVGLLPSSLQEATLSRNMLQVVVVAVLFGLALMAIKKDQASVLLGFMDSVQAVSMQIVAWAMTLAPIAVFGLLAQITIQIGFDALVSMSVYVVTVILGLLVLLGFYAIIAAVSGRNTPWKFLGAIKEVMLLAFSTSSSAAVMPLSIKTAEEKLNVSPTVAQFVIPLGATVNMAGTALYQIVAAVFLTQVFDIHLGAGELTVLIATTVGASIGSPATPGVGIVILATILAGIGVPTSGIALIIGVDRILDMCRTSVNVTGDLAACVFTDQGD